MKYTIYQLSENPLAFMPWFWVKDKFNFADYKEVYTGQETAEDKDDLLNKLFHIFNIAHPDDFRGHSMSVSDVIKLHGCGENGEDEYYFCDAIGWKKVEV